MANNSEVNFTDVKQQTVNSSMAMAVLRLVSKTTVFTDVRCVRHSVELDVFDRMPQRSTSSITDGYVTVNFNHLHFVDQINRITTKFS